MIKIREDPKGNRPLTDRDEIFIQKLFAFMEQNSEKGTAWLMCMYKDKHHMFPSNSCLRCCFDAFEDYVIKTDAEHIHPETEH